MNRDSLWIIILALAVIILAITEIIQDEHIRRLEEHKVFYGKGDIIELCDSIAEAKLPRYTVDMRYFGALESFVLALGEVQRGNMKGKDLDIYYQFFATYTELKELEANNEQQK